MSVLTNTRLIVWSIVIICTALMHYYCTASYNNFTITLEPQWIDLEKNPQRAEDFGGKWILAGIITFKKRIQECVSIHCLDLRWEGAHQEKLPNLVGSLYHKDAYKKFIPIEEFLLCDGKWDSQEQVLHLPFTQKCPLTICDVFYLVLTVPKDLEPIIKEGSFTIVENKLPQTIQMALGKDPLILSFKQVKTDNVLFSALHTH